MFILTERYNEINQLEVINLDFELPNFQAMEKIQTFNRCHLSVKARFERRFNKNQIFLDKNGSPKRLYFEVRGIQARHFTWSFLK